MEDIIITASVVVVLLLCSMQAACEELLMDRGLHYTPEELIIWRERAQNGPYLSYMSYPEIPDYRELVKLIAQYAEQKREYGATHVSSILAGVEDTLKSAIEELRALPIDPILARREPLADNIIEEI